MTVVQEKPIVPNPSMPNPPPGSRLSRNPATKPPLTNNAPAQPPYQGLRDTPCLVPVRSTAHLGCPPMCPLLPVGPGDGPTLHPPGTFPVSLRSAPSYTARAFFRRLRHCLSVLAQTLPAGSPQEIARAWNSSPAIH